MALLLAVALVAMIRRTPAQLGDKIPGNLGDPALVIWILRWGAHRLVTNPAGLFDANIFWPAKSTLAYADSLLSVTPVYAALYAITGAWTSAFNILLLLLMGLNLGATYSLTRWLTGRTAAGLISALAFGFSALVMAQMDHPQLQVVGLLPLGFLALFKQMERPTARRAIALGLVTAAIGLGALYWAAIWAVSVVVAVLGWLALRRGRVGRAHVAGFAAAGAIAFVAVAPTIPAYLHVQHTQPRRPMEAGLALHGRDLVRSVPGSWLYPSLARGEGPSFSDEHRLFIGFSTMGLAVVGAAALATSRRRGLGAGAPRAADATSDRSGYLLLLVLAGAASFALAIGGSYHHLPAPWKLLYNHVPGFGGIRVTARLAVIGLLAVGVLAGAGIDAILSRLRAAPVRLAVTGVLGLVVLAELAAPLPWAKLPADGATLAVYRELSHRPPGAVVELPIARPSLRWAYTEPPRMVYSTIDFHPRLNGYSGYLSPTYNDDTALLQGFPSGPTMDRLRLRRIRFLILHVGDQNGFQMYTEDEARRVIAELPFGAVAGRFGKAWLVDLGQA